MITTQAFPTIRGIQRSAWNDCFPGALEDWDYYVAVENASIADFQWRYLAVYEEDTLVAVAPAFITHYRLDTTVSGAGKRLTARLERLWPGLLQVGLYAIGSPVAERCDAGFASHVRETRRALLLKQLLHAARQDADALGIGLLAVKDAPSDDPHWVDSCHGAGFQSMPSLPTGVLPLPYGSVDAYLGSLGKSTRKDLRRKLRAAGPRVEWRRNIDDVLPDIMRLYEATLARAELQFERLPAGYFTGVLERLEGRAVCALYWVDEHVVAFNLLLVDEHRLVDKFFAHDVAFTRDYNLYFRSWLTNVDYCIEHKIALYECGQAGYASKLRLGCEFQGNRVYFRHRNRLVNGLLRLVKLFIRPDRSDPAMAAAISET
ncbi:GNAT family N-acetyltransferase [Pseudomonas syringae]|uniref:GNAT family N-acetyltransferase n=1 Tax=Pseudomonas syringae TaxID=317 RepID=A0A9Q3X2K5_PSESX|nr:GNAT family N-acetyltransferase [Pseudomonas syringae]MCF5063961.1 GNAT family N-acetyltransferase [Pseudomonas syringae]MCF5076338.1 GNAT family N-acetyltransferase [Pseudomonas syringae]MCF5121391.1 GNAT family N-acetyltransferase [Pseudomonas syringae]MCF5378113.1 GNAT family N-acetyltransferase [Pseudomonas syringae]